MKRIGGKADNLVSWYNNKGYHALPAYANALNNALLRAGVVSWIQASENNASADHCVECDYGISTFVEPIELAESLNQLNVLQMVAYYGTSIVMMVAFSFVPASCIIYLIGERQREEKQVCLLDF